MSHADPPASETGESGEKQTARLEAFSDGIFGIAMTLLVLDLKVPHLSDETSSPTASRLARELLSGWPGYLAFVTSFVSVLIMWVHHHTVFRLVRRADTRLLFTNGLLLLLVTLVPFPTAVVSEYLTTKAAPAACAFYAGTFVLIATAFLLMLTAAWRPGMMVADAPPGLVRRLRRSYRLGPPMYLIATAVAPFSPMLAMVICTALWIFWAIVTAECEPDDLPQNAA